jgi:hypothetical protein
VRAGGSSVAASGAEPGCAGGGEVAEELRQRKEERLFPFWEVSLPIDWAPMGKSFLLLFFKKEALA